MENSNNQSQRYDQDNIQKSNDQEKELPPPDNRSDSKSHKKAVQIVIVDRIYLEEIHLRDQILNKGKRKVIWDIPKIFNHQVKKIQILSNQN